MTPNTFFNFEFKSILSMYSYVKSEGKKQIRTDVLHKRGGGGGGAVAQSVRRSWVRSPFPRLGLPLPTGWVGVSIM